MSVSGCYLDGQTASYEHRDNVLTIEVPSTLNSGTIHKASVTYSGKPQDGLIIRKNKYKHFCVFADNWANRARYWFPSIDHPSDKATVSFRITVPNGYGVVANGTMTDTSSLQDKELTYTFRMDIPIPTYCMVTGVCNFAITAMKTQSGVPIYIYTFPEDSLTAVEGFVRVPDMVQYYESVIGPYPYSKLALVQSLTAFGGMENSSAIFLPQNSPSFTGRRNNEATLAHEIAHQWFGDDITESDWSELWLSEGFATYFEMLYYEARDGEQRFEELIKRTKEGYLRQSRKISPVIDGNYAKITDLLNSENYDKGALFLHALRKHVGDEVWFKGIKEYYRQFAHANATTTDFKNVMTNVSGKELDSLFQKWLYEPGLPE
jgi:aminopeptidase N